MRIGITCNLKDDLENLSPSLLPEDAAEEWDHSETIQAIQKSLQSAGHEVHLLGSGLEVIEKIKRLKIDFVFNLAEGFEGRNRESHIPAVLELLGIPYSGSDPLGLAAALDKSFAKRIALSLGISTPDFWTAERKKDLASIPQNRYPLFVKPLWEGSSKGIRLSSRVNDPMALEREFSRIFKDYSEQPVLIESHISGREVTIGILGNQSPEVMGMMEIRFRDPQKKDFCYSLETKRNWREEVEYLVPPKLEKKVMSEVQTAALNLFKALRLRDVARFDFRVDSGGTAYFLEVNPLPGLSPESGDLVILASKKGIAYRELILRILQAALNRYPELYKNVGAGLKPVPTRNLKS